MLYNLTMSFEQAHQAFKRQIGQSPIVYQPKMGLYEEYEPEPEYLAFAKMPTTSDVEYAYVIKTWCDDFICELHIRRVDNGAELAIEVPEGKRAYQNHLFRCVVDWCKQFVTSLQDTEPSHLMRSTAEQHGEMANTFSVSSFKQAQRDAGPTLRTRQRFEVFKRLKDVHPTWTQERIAREAHGELGEVVFAETVRNTYRLMGEKWSRGDRVR